MIPEFQPKTIHVNGIELRYVKQAAIPNDSHLLHGMNPKAYKQTVPEFLGKH